MPRHNASNAATAAPVMRFTAMMRADKDFFLQPSLWSRFEEARADCCWLIIRANAFQPLRWWLWYGGMAQCKISRRRRRLQEILAFSASDAALLPSAMRQNARRFSRWIFSIMLPRCMSKRTLALPRQGLKCSIRWWCFLPNEAVFWLSRHRYTLIRLLCFGAFSQNFCHDIFILSAWHYDSHCHAAPGICQNNILRYRHVLVVPPHAPKAFTTHGHTKLII